MNEQPQGEQQDDNQLDAFLESTRPVEATSDELANLDRHIQKNPDSRSMGLFTMSGLGIVFGILAIRFVIGLLRQLAESP